MACNTPDCGCVDCVEPPIIVPCTTCDCNPGFCDDGCADYPPTACVIYNGPILPCTGINTGDTMNQMVQKLNDIFCNFTQAGNLDKFVRISDADTTSGFLLDKINQDASNVEIAKTNAGGNEQISLNYTESFKVKTDGTDTEDFLINKVVLKEDPLGIITNIAITNENGKVAWGHSIDLDALCNALKASGCLTPHPVCEIIVTGLQISASEGGFATIVVGYTGEAPRLFEYIIDGGQILFNSSSTIRVSGLSAGTHTVSVKAQCSNGIDSNTVQGNIVIPSVNVLCPSISITSSDSTVAVAWGTQTGYTYAVQLSYSEFGAPLQSVGNVSGSYVFTGLTSAVEYWVRVLPTYLGETKNNCQAQSVFTTQQVCNATVGNIQVSNPSSAGTVQISWTGTGADSYEYRVDVSGVWTTAGGTSVSLSNISIGTHTFFVRAKCANGLYGTQAQATFIIPVATCTATIDSVSITNPTEAGTATASWTSTGAASFEYKLGTSGSWVPTTASTVNLNNLSAGSYTIFVRSRCSNNLYGGQNQGTFTIPQPTCNAVVSNLVISNQTSSGTATASWTGTGAIAYEYQGGLGPWTDVGPATSVNLSSVADGTVLSVRGRCANGLYGNTVSSTINIPQAVCSAPGQPTVTDVQTNTYNAQWTFTETDPYTAIQTGTDGLSYPHSSSVALGADLICNYGAEGNVKYLVQRIEIVEAAKTIWFNTTFNNGTFPDSVYYAPLIHGGYTYYITRDTFTFDSTSYSVTLKS